MEKEKDKKKGNETIIKCKDCGFKYYDGDIHKCQPVSAEKEIKETEETEETK